MEWDREGQYYHYLTKWMHHLNTVSRGTKDQTNKRWQKQGNGHLGGASG